MVLPSYPGLAGTIRAVFVRNPDGYPVGLFEITPTPATTAAPESNILGNRVTIVVDDLETACRRFRGLVDPDLKFWENPSFLSDKAYNAPTGTSGPFQMALALIPGSPVMMEFIQYRDHSRKFVRPHFQDPRATHILFMAKDDNAIMQRVKAAKLQTFSKTGGPVFIDPTTRSLSVTNPDGFWAEFMDQGVKKKPWQPVRVLGRSRAHLFRTRVGRPRPLGRINPVFKTVPHARRARPKAWKWTQCVWLGPCFQSRISNLESVFEAVYMHRCTST